MTSSSTGTAGLGTVQQRGLVGAIGRSLVYALAFSLILTFLVYLGLILGWIHLQYLKPIFLYGNYFAILFGATAAGSMVKGRGWLIGLVFAIVYFLMAAIIAPIWNIQSPAASIILIRLVIALVMGILGGMVGVNL